MRVFKWWQQQCSYGTGCVPIWQWQWQRQQQRMGLMESNGDVHTEWWQRQWQETSKYICLTSVTHAKPKEKMAFPA